MRAFQAFLLAGSLFAGSAWAQAPAPPAAPPPNVTVPAGLNLTNASLVEVIDILARNLKINYILDPRVSGKVTINTYGELKAVDVRNLLETILRMNGFAMVQVGNIYRIVPAEAAVRLPVSPQTDIKTFPDSEQIILNLVFLKYVTSAEMAKLLEPFMGEGAKIISYDPANLLMIQEDSRSMKRTLDLISMFDSETMAGQRVKIFTVTNGRPADITKDLETIFKAYSLSEKSSALKFIPIDRLNTIIAVAPNPAAFKDVAAWVEKLDVPVRSPAGAVDNHLYKLRYGRAEIVGSVISQLYGGPAFTNMSGYGLSGYGGYSGRLGTGSGFNGGTSGGLGAGAFGGGGFSSGGTGSGSAFSSGGAGSFQATQPLATATSQPAVPTSASTPFGTVGSAGSDDETGKYLSPGNTARYSGPRIIPNPFDNTLLIQANPQQWEAIQRLLEQLDVAPRQVLLDAKIYEVQLTDDLQFGVDALLQQKSSTYRGLLGETNKSGVGSLLSAGLLVGHSRELLAALTATDLKSRVKMLSAPQLIATDSIPASITVGDEVPTLAAQAITPGVLSGGNQVFTQSIQNVGTGVNLNVIARINATGVVTLVIDQDVSAPTASSFGSIGSASFSRRNVSTQVTVENGDTIAIGGIISESVTTSTNGVPFLNRLPYIGAVFGTKVYNKNRTEMIIFITPHVIFDTNQMSDATEEIKSRMKTLKHIVTE